MRRSVYKGFMRASRPRFRHTRAQSREACHRCIFSAIIAAATWNSAGLEASDISAGDSVLHWPARVHARRLIALDNGFIGSRRKTSASSPVSPMSKSRSSIQPRYAFIYRRAADKFAPVYRMPLARHESNTSSDRVGLVLNIWFPLYI